VRGTVPLLLVGALAIGAGGYWLGSQATRPTTGTAADSGSQPHSAPPATAAAEHKILYYRNPMGKPDYSPVPKKDSMGMDYTPVYEGGEDKAGPPAALGNSPPVPKEKGRILYFRNPMGLPDTSPAPKKDSMGMDYIPVYEGEAADEPGTVKISLAKVQELGVQSVPVERRTLTRTIRAVGTVQANERRIFVVNTKFDGWIDKLYVNATGERVRRGQPLMEIYAPELVIAQQEYLLALRSMRDMAGASSPIRASARQLAEAALQRLANWDISRDQIAALQRRGTVTRTLTLRAPADGTVMEKMAVEGMRFTAGDPLYRIADLTTVWLTADIFEQDLGLVRQGQAASITVDAYPGTVFSGKIDFVYPTVAQQTRTGKVRIIVPNPDGRLKTGMYANLALEAPVGNLPVLAIPDSAVIDSGTSQSVLVERGEGMFQPRQVKLGAHAGGDYEVRDGLAPGERVVVSANFLIDAESNLKAAFKAFAPPAAGGNRPSNPAPPPAGGKS
jgi:Cu(I)/Ag(I) efflux system membrane fusion protein